MVQKVEVSNGRIVAAVSGDIPGVAVPPALVDLPLQQLRLLGGVVVDGAALAATYVDQTGYLHAEGGPGRQPIAGSITTTIEPDGAGGWRAVDPADVARAALIVHLKEKRWQREVSGIEIEIAGETVLVSTARGDERATLHQTLSAIGLGLRTDGAAYNFADGRPRAVSNADMQAAILAALAHVQAAFDLERAITTSIEAGTINTTAQIDAAFANAEG